MSSTLKKNFIYTKKNWYIINYLALLCHASATLMNGSQTQLPAYKLEYTLWFKKEILYIYVMSILLFLVVVFLYFFFLYFWCLRPLLVDTYIVFLFFVFTHFDFNEVVANPNFFKKIFLNLFILNFLNIYMHQVKFIII